MIGGDTEVALDGRALGQPEDEAEAREHLSRLSGREHEVLGGLALLGPEQEGGQPANAGGRRRQHACASRSWTTALIDAYLASGEWRGRAGSYAIQGLGSALVEEVRGDVSNVIGLPVGLLLELAPELVPARGAPFQSA